MEKLCSHIKQCVSARDFPRAERYFRSHFHACLRNQNDKIHGEIHGGLTVREGHSGHDLCSYGGSCGSNEKPTKVAYEGDRKSATNIFAPRNNSISCGLRLGSNAHKSTGMTESSSATSPRTTTQFAYDIYQCMVYLSAQCGKPYSSAKYLESMMRQHHKPTAKNWMSVISSFSKIGKPEEAAKYCLLLEKSGHREIIAANSVMNAHAKASDLDGAEKWLARIQARQLSPDTITYTSLLNAAARAEQPKRAVKIFDDMAKSNVEHDARAANCVLDAFAKSGDAHGCARQFDIMFDTSPPADSNANSTPKKGKLKPTEVSFNSVMSAFAHTEDASNTLKWFNKLVEYGLEPTSITYNSLFYVYGAVGDVTAAEELFEKMRKVEIGCDKRFVPNAKGLRVDESCLTRNVNNMHSTRDVSNEISESKVSNRLIDAVSYHCMMMCYAKTGRHNHKMVELFNTMAKDGFKNDLISYNLVMDGFAKSGDTNTIIEWCRKAEQNDLKPDQHSYAALILSCSKRGDSAMSANFFCHMLQNGVLPNHVIFNSVISAYAKSTDVLGAYRWLRRMKRFKCKPNAVGYTSILHGAALLGDTFLGQRIFHKMERDGVQPTASVFSTMIDAVAKNGQSDHAMDYLKQMERRGQIPDVRICSSVLESFCRREDYFGAYDTLKMMEHKGVQLNMICFRAVLNAIPQTNCELSYAANVRI